MHEFIVWDKEKKEFLKDVRVDMNGDLYPMDDMAEENFSIDCNKITAHQYIGKTDINDNKIYADCSIVEIGFSWQESKDRAKGFFQYDKAGLCYVIWDIAKNDYIDFDLTKMQYMEIIDTIQENKLGLIKGVMG